MNQSYTNTEADCCEGIPFFIKKLLPVGALHPSPLHPAARLSSLEAEAADKYNWDMDRSVQIMFGPENPSHACYQLTFFLDLNRCQLLRSPCIQYPYIYSHLGQPSRAPGLMILLLAPVFGSTRVVFAG